MSNDIVNHDGRSMLVRNYLRAQDSAASVPLPVIRNKQTGLAPTYFPARVEGGVGASMLGLMLSHFSGEQPLVIQIGGLKSWAYRDLSDDRFVHLKQVEEENLIAAVLDHRMAEQNIERPAIIEFEQALPREAIECARWLAERLDGFVMFCPIASRQDQEFKFLARAREAGLHSILPLRQFGLGRQKPDEVLRVPLVPAFIVEWLQHKAPHLGYVLDNCERPVEAAMFADELQTFRNEIIRRMS